MVTEKHYEVTIKECGQDKPIVTEYIGKLSYRGIIDFYGLYNSDVEWFNIKIVV